MKTRITTAFAAAAALLIPVPVAGPAAAAEETRPAIEVLEQIEISEDASMDGYDRDAFAPSGWVDANGSGCTTREDILARDMDDETLQTDGCTVEYGAATGAYSGEEIEHIQGESQVDIEHVVAVGQAWRNGAHEWDEQTRQEFYQDEENLIAVSASENRTKGSDDVTSYMPPNQGVYCEFVAAKVYIKDKYELTMNPEEHAFIGDVLNNPECEGTPAAPAQAMYTADWDTAPAADGGDDDQAAPGDLSEALENPMLVGAGVVLIVSLIAVLILSQSARNAVMRAGRRQARRSTRRALR